MYLPQDMPACLITSMNKIYAACPRPACKDFSNWILSNPLWLLGGLVKLVLAVAHHFFCLSLPAAFTQPGTSTLYSRTPLT